MGLFDAFPPHLARMAEQTALYMRDRYAFLTECVYTQDEVAKEDERVKLIPEKEYLRLLVEEWQTVSPPHYPQVPADDYHLEFVGSRLVRGDVLGVVPHLRGL